MKKSFFFLTFAFSLTFASVFAQTKPTNLPDANQSGVAFRDAKTGLFHSGSTKHYQDLLSISGEMNSPTEEMAKNSVAMALTTTTFSVSGYVAGISPSGISFGEKTKTVDAHKWFRWNRDWFMYLRAGCANPVLVWEPHDPPKKCVPPGVSLQVIRDAVRPNDQLVLQANATTGTSPFQYNWNGPGMGIISANGQNYTSVVLPAGTYTFTVTVSNACGSSNASITRTIVASVTTTNPCAYQECWDANFNCRCDLASEDVNRDGRCDRSDCLRTEIVYCDPPPAPASWGDPVAYGYTPSGVQCPVYSCGGYPVSLTAGVCIPLFGGVTNLCLSTSFGLGGGVGYCATPSSGWCLPPVANCPQGQTVVYNDNSYYYSDDDIINNYYGDTTIVINNPPQDTGIHTGGSNGGDIDPGNSGGGGVPGDTTTTHDGGGGGLVGVDDGRFSSRRRQQPSWVSSSQAPRPQQPQQQPRSDSTPTARDRAKGELGAQYPSQEGVASNQRPTPSSEGWSSRPMGNSQPQGSGLANTGRPQPGLGNQRPESPRSGGTYTGRPQSPAMTNSRPQLQPRYTPPSRPNGRAGEGSRRAQGVRSN